ncbi:MAG TPA: IclR family transcriptional regulator [Caulobacteraceae bacterium]|nr:IclR family transcriptional regulator [Caulobacteraceae bacterium]
MLDTLVPAPTSSDLESVDLVLRLLEYLAHAREPRGVTEVARALDISKPRAHRHLRALLLRGYVRQDPRTEGYEIGVKLLALGESVRDRFDVAGAIRPSMAPLREQTGLAVTASALIEDHVVVVEMLQGRTLIDFAIRPGSRLDFHASAHGLIALAFGPQALLERVLAEPLKAWTAATVTDPAALRALVEQVRQQGWATAADAVQLGVNALAAPVFDHRGEWRGAVALVGATQFIPDLPSETLLGQVKTAAADASRRLGWGV